MSSIMVLPHPLSKLGKTMSTGIVIIDKVDIFIIEKIFFLIGLEEPFHMCLFYSR